MSRKIVKAALFFLAVLVVSAPAWCSAPADTGPTGSTASLTAETGAVLPGFPNAGFILAKNGGGKDKDGNDSGSDGDCDGPEGNQGEEGDQDQDQDRDQNQGQGQNKGEEREK